MSSPVSAKPIAVSMGEPGGIGPEIILKAYAAKTDTFLPFFVLADPDLLRSRAELCGLSTPIQIIEHPLEAAALFSRALPVLPLSQSVEDRLGVADKVNAPLVIEAIERGVKAIAEDMACALVTAPIQKKPLYESGFEHPGHTEFLAELANTYWPATKPHTSVMMLAGPDLKTIPVTCHIPLSMVSHSLSTELIVETIQRATKSLHLSFGLSSARVAVTGLNPHAGEGGALGSEDDEIIAPAIDILQKSGIRAFGPLPADTLFHKSARQNFDVAVAMYHDQALIPVKALAFDETVNVTLGLPFLRTSPDHGTALDIANKGIARPDSMIAAMEMAANAAMQRP